MTAWCVLERNCISESFTDLKVKYMLDKQDFYRYLQLRDYYNTEIRGNSSKEVNGIIQIIKNIYKGAKIRIISAIYTHLMSGSHSTDYIKKKWEAELSTEITEKEWSQMWEFHQSTTNSRIWREFSWKNLIRFFITPKIKSKQTKNTIQCWRECGNNNVDHTHIFWKCPKIENFWKTIHEQIQRILGYDFSMDCKTLYLGSLVEGGIGDEDWYLVKILLAAAWKAITRKWGQTEPPNQSQWEGLVEDIYIMEKLTFRLRLQEERMDKKWQKWKRLDEV